MGGIFSGQQSNTSNMAVRQDIDKLISDYPVFVVEKRSCPFCKTAKSILNSYDIPDDLMLIKDISGDPQASEIQDYMSVLTGGRTVPRVFIGGKCIGGGNETSALHQSKKLVQLLRAAKAIV